MCYRLKEGRASVIHVRQSNSTIFLLSNNVHEGETVSKPIPLSGSIVDGELKIKCLNLKFKSDRREVEQLMNYSVV